MGHVADIWQPPKTMLGHREGETLDLLLANYLK